MLSERIRFEAEIRDLGLRFQPASEFDQAQSGASRLLATMVGQGESENAIANALFYQRHPKLRGQRITDRTHQAQWLSIRDKQVRPAVRAPLRTWKVDPLLLASFLSQPEQDTRVPSEATAAFLTQGPLLTAGRSVRDALLGRWKAGNAPAVLSDLDTMARLFCDHPGAIMLLCHNVTKALARGSEVIAWNRISNSADTYSDGKNAWKVAIKHKSGIASVRGKPSMFYLLFSGKTFGIADAGDWYHYYLTATFTAFDGMGALTDWPDGRGRSRSRSRVREFERGTTDISQGDYKALLGDHLSGLYEKFSQTSEAGQPGYRGWLLANSVSFLEGGRYGDTQTDVDRESKIHIKGALAGLRAAGVKPNGNWAWHVPAAGGVTDQDLLFGYSVQSKINTIWTAKQFLK